VLERKSSGNLAARFVGTGQAGANIVKQSTQWLPIRDVDAAVLPNLAKGMQLETFWKFAAIR
jgi:hypothetical protein